MTRRRARLVVGLDGNVDLGHVGELRPGPGVRLRSRSEPERGGEALELLDVRRVGSEAGEADADELAARRAPRRSCSSSSSVGPPGSGMKTASSSGSSDVAVEGDVDGVGPVEQRAGVAADPGRRDELLLRRIEVARADRGRRRRRRPCPRSSSVRSGIPHSLPDGDVSGVLRSPCASSQSTPTRPCRGGQPLDGADVRAAAAAEHERPLRGGRRRRRASASRASPPRRRPPPDSRAAAPPPRPSARRRRPRPAARGRGRRRTSGRTRGTRTPRPPPRP